MEYETVKGNARGDIDNDMWESILGQLIIVLLFRGDFSDVFYSSIVYGPKGAVYR